MYCPKCHLEFGQGAAFCGSCGNPLVNGAVSHEQGGMAMGYSDCGAAVSAVASSTRRLRIRVFAAIAAIVLLVISAFLIYVAFFKPYDISARNFPDPELRAQLGKRQYDADQDGKLSRAEAAAISDLDLSGREIESLVGLHLFENLVELDLSRSTGLTSVEWDEVPHLESVDLTGSEVRSFDGSAVPELRILKAKESALKTVDVSNNPKLERLELDNRVKVVGIESTGLEPRFLLTSFERFGKAQGFYTGPGQIGFNYDETIFFTYDENHLLVGKAVNVNTSGDTWSYHTYRYEYDDEGRLLEYRIDDSSSSSVCYKCIYNDRGKLDHLEQDGGANEAKRAVVLLNYDRNGRIVGTSLAHDGQIYQEYTYEYGQGQLARIHIDYGGGYEEVWTIDRDRSGRITSIDSSTYSLKLEYDDWGRCIEKRLTSSGGYESAIGEYVTTYEFSSDGTVEKAHCDFESLGSTFQLDVTCTYDEYGNELSRSYDALNPQGNASSGYAAFSYERYFDRKDAPESPEVLLAGDYASVIQSQGALDVDLLGGDSPIVKQFLIQSLALYGEFNL